MKPDFRSSSWWSALLLAAVCLLAGCAHKPNGETGRPGPITPVDDHERPGLGTGTGGEPRESWVEPAYFARSSSEKPAGYQRILYNDRDACEAALDYYGGKPTTMAGLQPVAGGLLCVGLRDGAGRWFDTWDLRGQRYVVGERNARYEIVIRNETRRRLEIVVSVDGLDVMDGEKRSPKKRGHVLDPRETMAVEGFRISESRVNAFRFTNMNDTYSNRVHHETKNVGAISFDVFAERWLGTPTKAQRPEDKAFRPTAPKDPKRPYVKPPDV